MPFRPSQQNPQGEYIYFVGGYNSEDRGTPPWGSLVESENLFIGDRAGEIVIAYADGTADVIPLIFGYTMWFKANWRDGGAPFKTEEAEPAMTACLRKALQLQGGFEGNDQTAIKVKIQSKPIREIRLADNPRKAGGTGVRRRISAPVRTSGKRSPAANRSMRPIRFSTRIRSTADARTRCAARSNECAAAFTHSKAILRKLLRSNIPKPTNAPGFRLPATVSPTS